MQRIGAPSLLTGNIFRVFVGALVAGLLLPTIGIVIGGGLIAVIVNALIGACGIFFQLLTTALSIAGAVVALLVGQLIGWYLDQGADVMAATLSAMFLLLIWPRLVAAKVILDTTSLSVLRTRSKNWLRPSRT